MSTLQERWHGAPVWMWAAGGTVLAGGAVYVYKRRKGSTATAATGDTSAQSQDSSGAPFPGAGSYLPPGSGTTGSDVASQTQSLVGQITSAAGDAISAINDAGSKATAQASQSYGAGTIAEIASAGQSAVQAVQDAVAQAIPAITPAAVPAPVASAPSPPPPPAAAPAPIIPVGWQEAIGLSPAPSGQTAVPVYASDNTIVGERFTGVSTEPKPWNIIDNPPPPDQVRQSIYGPVTLAEYNLLRPDQRL